MQDRKLNTPAEEAPFFARFLEGQEFPQVQSDIKAGPGGYVTMKYPSDDDDFDDIYQ